MAHYIEAHDSITDAGYNMAIIGNGTAMHLQDFIEHYPGVTSIYTDPSLQTYRALELNHGVSSLMSLRLVSNGLRATRSGHKQGHTAGDPLQQGGIAVISQQGNVLFVHREHTSGDHLPSDRLLNTLAKL